MTDKTSQLTCVAYVLDPLGFAVACDAPAVQRVTNREEVRYFCPTHKVKAEDL